MVLWCARNAVIYISGGSRRVTFMCMYVWMSVARSLAARGARLGMWSRCIPGGRDAYIRT